MAIGDKLTPLDGLKAVHDYTQFQISLLETIEWNWGTLAQDGSVTVQDGTDTNKSKYSGPFSCPRGLTVTVTFPERKYALVMACAYDAAGQLVGERTNIIQKYAEAAQNFTATGTYTMPEGAAYIRLAYRSYGVENALTLDGVKHSVAPDMAAAELEARVTALEAGLPDYWQSALDTVRGKIRTRDLNLTKGDRFFFVTDPHWSAQANKSSSALIGTLSDEFRIRLCLMGGDVVRATPASAAAGYNEMANYLRSFKNRAVKILPTAGNHDLRSDSAAQVYNALMRQAEDFAHTSGSLTGTYYDNESAKVRYISFNYPASKVFDEDVADWVGARCNEVPRDDGWAIVVMCHAYWDGAAEEGEGGTLVPNSSIAWGNHLLALKANGAPIALWLVGHCHIDQHAVLDNGSGTKLLVVSTMTDNVSSGQTGLPGYARADGTDTESAFDVIHLDTAAEKVYLTRVGGWFIGPNDDQAIPPKVQPVTGDRAFDYATGAPISY